MTHTSDIEAVADAADAGNDRSKWPYVTKPRLSDVEARAAAATEGPWRATRWEDFSGKAVTHSIEGETGVADYLTDGSDATFIAASRTDVPALTAAIRAVLAIEPPFVDEYTDVDEKWNDALTGYRTAIRAALSAHIDLDAS